jgi:hypothetical protein
MAAQKKPAKAKAKAQVQVKDLKAKKDPKGGGLWGEGKTVKI